MSLSSAPRLARYYDWLGWFQRAAGWIGRGGGYQSLTVHRLLSSDQPGVAAADVVHERLLAALGPIQAPRVIDAGCGLGGTIFYLHARLGGQYDGLTVSPTQRARAEREARRRGVSDACRFHLRSYDQDLDDLTTDGADLIVAIESLAHAADPARTIANLARTLRPGGRLTVIDDVPDEALSDEDPDFEAFREGWCCRAVARSTTLTNAFAAAGLEIERDEDLTSLVILRDPQELERLVRINRRWQSLLSSTAAGALVDSLHGGLMLERLYRRGVIGYRLLLGRRPSDNRRS